MPVIEEDYVGFGIDKKTGKRHAINHLPKVAEWQDEIYQYEQKDKLIGGIDGIDNLQGQELANRTEYLKAQSDAHAEDIRKIKEEGIGVGVLTMDISIPATGWRSIAGDYPYCIDIANEKITEDMIPTLTILPISVQEAADCGICPACEFAKIAFCTLLARHVCTPSMIQWAVYFLIIPGPEALGTSETRDRWVQLRIACPMFFLELFNYSGASP